MHHEAEKSLIRQARRGDPAAVERLIRTHQESVYGFLLRLSGRPHVAEDLAQEAFVRVLRNLDRFDDRYRFSTWLFTIGKRLLVNAQQKMKPTADSEMVEYRAGDARTPLSEVESAERVQNISSLVDIAIGALGSPQREIVLMFHQQGWSVQRIAEELGMPEGTIKSHLFRARRRMLFAIEQSGRPNPDEVLR